MFETSRVSRFLPSANRKKSAALPWVCVATTLSLFAIACGSSDEPLLITEPATEPTGKPPVSGGVNGAQGGKPAEVNGRLRVCGTKLCNEDGFPIQLRGMSTHGLQWYGWDSCITEDSLTALSDDWGADIVRLSLYVERDAGGYQKAPGIFTAQVDQMIEEVSKRGMYVIIDWHQLSDGDPRTNLEDAKTYFTHMSETHGHRKNVFYEIANEPLGVSWAEIKEYAEVIIPIIRGNDPDSIIIVGTPQWSSLGLSGGSDSPSSIADSQLDFDNLMYTFHFYAGAHGSYLSRVRSVADELPIFVTEWGTQDASGDGPNDFDTAQKFLDMFYEKQISWVNWNYSDDERSGAVFKPGTCNTKGPWTGESLKEAGTWMVEHLLSPADDFPVDEDSRQGEGGAGGESGSD